MRDTSAFAARTCGGTRARPKLVSLVIAVRYQRGVYLPEQDLWMDPWDGQRFAFVSHAHSDHVAPHREIIVSERTAHVLRSRLSGRRIEHILPFGKRQTLNGVDLMLLPAGHIFGSAQCLVSADARGCRSIDRFLPGNHRRGPGAGAARILAGKGAGNFVRP